MKKIAYTILYILLGAATANAQKVTFVSAEFEQGVRAHLGLDEDEDVQQSQTDTITRLNLSGLGIKILSDVTSLPKVKELDLSDNDITDVAPLAELDSLQSVSLMNNLLRDASQLTFTRSTQMTVNVGYNYISDFTAFLFPGHCRFTMIGMNKQQSEDEQVFDVCQFYVRQSDQDGPVIVYRGVTNMVSPTLMSGEAINETAVLDGSTHFVPLGSKVKRTTKVILSNGNRMDSTYVVPVMVYTANEGETITIKTGLPEHYHIAAASAQKGTVVIDGTTLLYTAPAESTSDCVAFSYYEGSRLRGYGRLNIGQLNGDVNGDGDVDIADAVCIVNHVVGKPNTTFNASAADVNGDGDIDIADAVRIVNLVVGKIQSLSRSSRLK